MFLQGEIFYRLRENRKLGVRLKKKGEWCFKFRALVDWLWILYACPFLFCFEMRRRKCIKNTQHGSLEKFFLSLFKCREITIRRKKKERVGCSHTEPRYGPAEFR